MAQIGSRGLVDDGSANLSVAGSTTLSGNTTIVGNVTLSGQVTASVVAPASTLTGDTNVLATPGFYRYGGTNVQATLPRADSLPGATFVFGPRIAGLLAGTGGVNIVLSGSAAVTGSTGNNTAVFYMQLSGSAGGTGINSGQFLTTATSGSVGLMSDGFVWNVLFNSGSLTFA